MEIKKPTSHKQNQQNGSDMSTDPLQDDAIGFTSTGNDQFIHTMSYSEFSNLYQDSDREDFLQMSALAYPTTDSNRPVTRSVAKANRVKLDTGLLRSRKRRKDSGHSKRVTRSKQLSSRHMQQLAKDLPENDPAQMPNDLTDRDPVITQEPMQAANRREVIRSTLIDPNYTQPSGRNIQHAIPRTHQTDEYENVYGQVPPHLLRKSAPIIVSLPKDSILRTHLPKQVEIDAILTMI